MSATTPSTPTSVPTLDISGTSATPLSRLVSVEVRKAIDTRAGFWFGISIVGLVLAVEVIFALAASDADRTFENHVGIAGAVLGYFLPIFVIMLVTSEASQRNGLVTFTLEPKRSRVVLAKFLAGLVLAVVVMVLSVVMAVIGMLIGGGDEWGLDGNLVFNGFILSAAVAVLIGFAIATLLMNTPAAIVGYFAYTLILPTAVGILMAISDTFEDIAPWIEFNTAQMPLFSGDYTPTGEEWAQIATSGFIWLVVPLVLGIRRLLRIEFK